MLRLLPASILVLLLVSGLILNPLVPATASAQEKREMTFAELVRNTKEAESVLLADDDLAEAENFYPADDTGIQTGLTAAFADLANSHEICEPRILSRLQAAMATRGLPSDSTELRFALLLLRQKNLIDDIALYPLLAAYPAWAEVGYRETDWLRTDSTGRIVHVGCPTENYLQVVAAVKSVDGRKFKRKHLTQRINEAAKERGENGELRYLPVQITWLHALRKTRFDRQTTFALGPILKEVADAKNSSPRADLNEKPSKVMSKRKKNMGGLSNRLALYSMYNSFQILMLSAYFKKFTERMDLMTADAEIVIKYKNGQDDEIYPLSEQEQYRMAAKMLHSEIENLKLSGLFEGKSPTFDDVIVASLETGFIHASELDAAMSVDQIWNPKVSGWAKVVTILKKYGATALVLIPNPFSFWAALGITLTETVITKKIQGPGDADDRGISIF